MVADYTTAAVEMLEDLKAGDVHAVLDIPFAEPVEELHGVFRKRQ
jgi:hypothetical protein